MARSSAIHPLAVRLAQLTLVSFVLLAALPGRARAVEVPVVGIPTYIQTNGPTSIIGNGDWYTNVANGTGAGYHYLQFNVPCGWPTNTPIAIDLFSPEMNTITPLSDEPEDAVYSNTAFELYPAGTSIGPAPDQPAAGTGIPGTLTTYIPSNAAQQWVRYYTLPAPVVCGQYVLRSQTFGNDENSWRLRVGLDNDADPTNAPPANIDNPDGLAGTNDELTIGIVQTTYQHNVAVPPGTEADTCLTLHEYVPPGQPTLVLHNFDLDSVGRVRYYSPADTFDPIAQTGGTAGTVSGPSVWNGGTTTSRGTGDVIANPISGWWRIVTCTIQSNQYIQEGQASPGFIVQPPTPVMALSKDDGRTIAGPNDTLTYTIAFTNTSNTTATPGAATNVVLSDALPPNTNYVSCAVDPRYGGTCAQAAGVVTFNLAQTVSAGASGSVQVTVQVNPNISCTTTTNVVTLTYNDSLGNPYTPLTATDVDTCPPTAIALLNFAATQTSQGVTLSWQTGAELNTWGFQLYRATGSADAPAELVTPQIIVGRGRDHGAVYEWADTSAQAGVAYWYWLREIELNGTTSQYGPVRISPELAATPHHVFIPLSQ